MGLTVNRQIAKNLTVNRQKWNIFTVNRQMGEPKLAVKFLSNLVPRAPLLSQGKGPANEVDFSDILKRSRPPSYAVNK